MIAHHNLLIPTITAGAEIDAAVDLIRAQYPSTVLCLAMLRTIERLARPRPGGLKRPAREAVGSEMINLWARLMAPSERSESNG